MGNSVAYPVFRTADKAEAYRRAELLSRLLTRRHAEVWLTADLETVEDVRRMAAAVPGARYEYVEIRTDPDTGAYIGFDLDIATAHDDALRPELPLVVSASVPWGSVEDRFVAALGQGMADIDWQGAWPDDPDAAHPGWAKYDGVQLLFHCDDQARRHRSDRHTVYVHVTKWGDPARARKLAAYVGGAVLGEETGW
ncbi:hypothetical protein ACGFZB_00765 [Streptomyces cinerochromogenes]|uniref:Uncharacterized protein n=1 Tax=Streptomyces cinerochromogenes TaxID=66422 RepID=A0ABW7AWW8_9ACTN